MDERILLADDEAILVLTLSRALEASGFAVDTASTGAEALRRAGQHPYAVVVTDLGMAGADGLQVIRAAKQRDPDTAVLVITGYSNEDAGLVALQAGAEDYLFKPFQPEELILRVTRHAAVRDLRRKLRKHEELAKACPNCRRAV